MGLEGSPYFVHKEVDEPLGDPLDDIPRRVDSREESLTEPTFRVGVDSSVGKTLSVLGW